MKGLSVLFTIFLFLLAAKLSRQLKLSGALPEQAHGHAESVVNASFASPAPALSPFARYPSAPQQNYN